MKKLSLLLIMAVLFNVGCRRSATEETVNETGKPVVLTTFYPTLYFVQRIGGDLLAPGCPLPDDADPIFWVPDRKSIAMYQKADLIVLNGAGFEQWTQKVSLPESRVVDCSAGFKDGFMKYENAKVHSHGKGGEHAHEGLDGHTWVDPLNAVQQADAIKNALVRKYPEHEVVFEKGHSALVGELKGLDRRLSELMANAKDVPLLASHPAYNYIARRYKWNVKSLDLDPGEVPSEEAIKNIRELTSTHPAKFILWESEPEKSVSGKLKAELGLESLVFSPCELLSDADIKAGRTYISVMNENIDSLSNALSAEGK